jgi:hypothetical protein
LDKSKIVSLITASNTYEQETQCWPGISISAYQLGIGIILFSNWALGMNMSIEMIMEWTNIKWIYITTYMFWGSWGVLSMKMNKQ